MNKIFIFRLARLLVLALFAGVVSGLPSAEAQSFSDVGFFSEQVAQFPPYSVNGIAFAPDGRSFIWQTTGVVWILQNGSVLQQPFLDFSAEVNQQTGDGMLGLALDPNFATNGYVYVLYTYEKGRVAGDTSRLPARITRVTADPLNPNRAIAGSEVNIVQDITFVGVAHFANTLRFGADGKLYASFGDGSSYTGTDANTFESQDLGKYAGKIIRINPDGTAPSDNPFYDGTNSIRSKVYSYGLRNPFRFAIQPTTGEVYVADVGWNTWEEINTGRGKNFGWPCFEGPNPQPQYLQQFAQCQQLSSSAVTAPWYTYNHTEGIASVSGAFYTGNQYPPQYQGNLFIGDYGENWMRRVILNGDGSIASVVPFATNADAPVAIELGRDGFLYYVAFSTGQIRRIRFTGSNLPPVASATSDVIAGYSPLTVNFSSAGSSDPEGGSLRYLWEFGDGQTSTAANPSHTYTSATVRSFDVKLTVIDLNDASTSTTLKITIGSLPPAATITTPADGTKVNPGDVVTFSGIGTDPDDGQLAPSSLTWNIRLHHNEHIHLVGAPFPGSGGSITIDDHGQGTFAYEIILTATDSSGLQSTRSINLPVRESSSIRLDFTYPDRASLLAGGWSYTAKTASGASRNTEQGGALSPNYDQSAHPGSLRMPIGSGELWQSENNSQNTLFYALPSNWTSIRLKIASFAPISNNQQVGLLLYDNDDNYLDLNRVFINGQFIELFSETASSTALVSRVPLNVNSNLLLRLDKDANPNTYAAFYSTDDGATWTSLGATVIALNAPKLAIQTGANGGGPANADLAYVQIETPPVATIPAPSVTSVTPNSGRQAEALTITINGANLQDGATCGFGPGVTVDACTFVSAQQMRAAIIIDPAAEVGVRTITVSNPDGKVASLVNGFGINANNGNPVLTSLAPGSGLQGQVLSVTLTGANFKTGATCSFGPGITVSSCVFGSATSLSATIGVAADAALGLRNVSVTNPDGASTTLRNAFSVNTGPPSVTGISPVSGNPGQALSVSITGGNFRSGATCGLGAGITVNSCSFVSASQLTANISISSSATLGARTAAVTNPDAQTGSLANAFTVYASGTTPTPAVTSVAPANGLQGQTLSLTITGSGFQTGATCSLGSGITVHSCSVNSSSQITATASIQFAAATGSRTAVITNSSGKSGSLAGAFNVTANPEFKVHVDFTYATRTALLNDAWSYQARTASGAVRNTEQSGTLSVNYDQVTHPNSIRIPLGPGELWQNSNNSENTLFRYLPSDWNSVRMKISKFSPSVSDQQADLVVYQDDDNYIAVNRGWIGGSVVEMSNEAQQSASLVSRSPITSSGNLLLRIDRSGTAYTGFFSTDDGVTWTELGTVSRSLSSPRIAIQTGANPGGTIHADVSWVEIFTTAPPPTISGASPSSGAQGQVLAVTISGTGFRLGATCNFGVGITVNSCSAISGTQLTANIAITRSAVIGSRPITVVNSDGQAATSAAGFSVTQAPPPPPPTVSGFTPASAQQGQTLNVTITGTGFESGSTCDFGVGVTTNSCTLNSSTQMTASITVGFSAPQISRSVTVTNSDLQSASRSGFSITPAAANSVGNLTAVVLVNSANLAGYNESAASPGDFQKYIRPYLDHLQIPYQLVDTAAQAPFSDLATRPLIIAAHNGLSLSASWQSAISNAVSGGAGFVNFDAATDICTAAHMQSLFGCTGSQAGSPASSVAIPVGVMINGSSPHFIAALQRKFAGDPAGDKVFAFHPDANNIVQTVTATVLNGATATVIAKLGNDPLILARTSGAGRAVNFGSYMYLKADRFGFVQGVDDLFWRSLVWAARKPFVLRGYPRLFSVQMDDTEAGWPTRVKDLYNTSFTGTAAANGTGGPWKITGYVFTANLPAGTSERTSAITDINAGKLRISPHSINNVAYGDMYWNADLGQLNDSGWAGKMDQIKSWMEGDGGTDTIPALSRSMVGHYWDISNNVGYDLWNDFGFRYITSIQKPGFAQPVGNVNLYSGAERLASRDYWTYEKPPKTVSHEDYPFSFVDDYVIGSRAGLPAKKFLNFATQFLDFSRYSRPDFVWPSTQNATSVAQSVDQLQRYVWRHWSGLGPVQIFTHDSFNYQLSTVSERQTVITQASQWLTQLGVKHIFMDDLGDYLYARTKSALSDAQLASGQITLRFGGSTATADGSPINTEVLVFQQDLEGLSVTIPGFTGGAAATFSVPTPGPAPTLTSVSPSSGNAGATLNVTLTGTNFQAGLSCSFGADVTVNSCGRNSATQVVANVTIASSVPAASRTITVFNPDGQTAVLANAFTLVPPAAPSPVVSSVAPASGNTGQALSVTLTGSSFQTGAACSFGAGITVNSCAFSSATQLIANITISSSAAAGARTVTVTNTDGKSGSLTNGFTVTIPAPSPAPALSSISPASASQGQSLSVTLTGSNFQSGALCSFGASISVLSCAFNSSTSLTASITVNGSATTGTRDVSVTNPDGQISTLPASFTVTPAADGLTHIDFAYADRTSLLAAGWSFTASTASGGQRNTEQLSGLVVDYNQSTHPSVIRVPLGSGELWQGLNNSQNTLFRSLPANWTSVRLKLAAFNPSASYQQTGLLLYQDDDTYIDLNRLYANGGAIELFRENAGSTALVNRTALSAITNLLLRIDKTGANTYAALYSTDNGVSWINLGSLTLVVSNARLAIQTGSNPSPGAVSADLAWVEIISGGVAPPPVVSAVSPSSAQQGQTTNVTITGTGFQSGATCGFGAGVTVNTCSFTSGTQLVANLSVSSTAALGSRNVTVTNPDNQASVLTNGFTINSSAPVPAPSVTSISPSSGLQGQSQTVTINGSNFQNGAGCAFGAGITVSACTFNSSSQLSAAVSIAANAATGARTVSVTNPDTQSGSLANSFTVNANAAALTHVDFNYSSRTALLADGWSYTAKTASGASRNTEQATALLVNYDQTAHPGSVRVPLGGGELWQTLNNSQNTLFRSIPTDWTSLRVKIAAFSPVASYQQLGLLLYQDDDNYLNVNRLFASSNSLEMFRESGTSTLNVNRVAVTNTGNLILRIDKGASANSYTGMFSTDGGVSWTVLGTTTVTLNAPVLGIQTGSNPTPGSIAADIAWVEILR